MSKIILSIATFGIGLVSLSGFLQDDKIGGLLALGVGIMGLGCIGIISAIENNKP